MIVSMIALAAIHAARTEVDQLVSAHQISAAEMLAQSAIEFALTRLANDSAWRSTYSSGVEVPAGASWLSLGDGQVKFILVDDDGNLNDDAKDNVTLYGVGRRGDATSVASVQLQPGGASLNCLDASIHASGNVNGVWATITSSQTVSTNGLISMIGGGIVGDAWAVGTIASAVSGTAAALQTPPREMPDAATLFDYYLANGTAISMAAIPNARIENVVVSASSNPYGATNPQGIYVIDTQGQTLRIRDCRIEATLVILSPGNTTEIDGRIFWTPAAPSLPSLLVRGGVEMRWSGASPLSESSAGANFNPASTPYLGVADADMSDNYPGVIRGLVYASGGVYASSTCTLEGTLVTGGVVNATAAINMTYVPVNRNNPPPGFSGGSGVRVLPGTWKRTARQ